MTKPPDQAPHAAVDPRPTERIEVNSLDEVRENIDRLDRAIIRLMAERGQFVEQAARFKTSTADVEAPKRVEQVIAKVRALAEESGLPPQVAEAAYRAMIAAFIKVEQTVFETRRNG
jgi:isochorismate pyruvate lyase